MIGSFNRPRMIAAVVLAALILGTVAPKGNAALPQQSGPEMAQAPAPGKLIVAFPDKNASESEVAAVLARHGLALDQWLPGLGLARATVRAGTGAAAAGALSADADIDYVTQERLSVEVADAPQDEFWSEQWGPAKVGLPAARDLIWGDASVVIAVVDTGVNYWHWDLRDQIWINPGESEVDPATGVPTCSSGIAVNGQDDDGNGYTDDCRGYNFDSGDNNPTDVYGHGTAVAGIAGAATNNPGHYTSGRLEGIAGMGGATRLMALRAMNASGSGSPFNISEAVQYAADQGAQVINLSLTLPVNYNLADADTLCRATDYAQSKGSLVVGASGNHSTAGLRPVSYPAACPGVLAVGASTRQDTRATFSDAGSRLDLVAPGEGIYTTLSTSNTSYGRWNNTGSGTSFSAPHVAGAAALLLSLRPDLVPAAINELLRNTADDVGSPGFDFDTGWGRINVARAASKALDGLTVRVIAEPAGVAIGASRKVRVQVLGPGGVPASMGARINLISSLGMVSPTIVTTDANGAATTVFTPGSTLGAGSVTATLGTLTTTLTVLVGRPLYYPLVARYGAITK